LENPCCGAISFAVRFNKFSRLPELSNLKLSDMKKSVMNVGKPLFWLLLAISALVLYFSQIAARMEYNQAIIGLVFFLVAILDVQSEHISLRRFFWKVDAGKFTRKMMLIVSILIPIAGLSLMTGWSSLPANLPPGPWHPDHHAFREHGEWFSVLLHSMTNLITFRY
jgi:hypothetical protein